MSRELFGTDGVRGQAGQYPLDDETIGRIGVAIAELFGGHGKVILLGRDPRESSPHITELLSRGLLSNGSVVKSIGVIPTPGLAYLTAKTSASAGVMVTASHNPYLDNGIKVFTGRGLKLTDDQETHLNEAIMQAESPTASIKAESAENLAKAYEEFLLVSAKGQNLDGMKLAIDTANGATSGLAQRVFSKLGADVTALFNRPDGRNINQKCGATDTAAIAKVVVNQQLDAGVALDGDGDRVVLIDEKGRSFGGDRIVYVLAVTGAYKGVVVTTMSNIGLEKSFAQRGIKLQRTAVGDRYVLEGLRQTGFKLGGEQSGHIILPELSTTGDGLLAAIHTLLAVKASNRSLAAWRDELKLEPQSLESLKVKDKSVIDNPAVKDFIARQTAKLEGRGRIMLRASGTEPVLRLMVEGPSAERLAQDLVRQLRQVVDSI